MFDPLYMGSEVQRVYIIEILLKIVDFYAHFYAIHPLELQTPCTGGQTCCRVEIFDIFLLYTCVSIL